MTSDNLLDLLADYAAGVLDPAAADEVTRRLAADPEVAALASAVRAAQTRVTADLAGLADEPMPAAVAQRLTAVLDAAADRALPGPTDPGRLRIADSAQSGTDDSARSRADDSGQPVADDSARSGADNAAQPGADDSGELGVAGSGQLGSVVPRATGSAAERAAGRGRGGRRGASRPEHPAPPTGRPAGPSAAGRPGGPSVAGRPGGPSAVGRPGGRSRWVRAVAAAGGVVAAAVLVVGGFAVLGHRTTAGDTASSTGKAAQAPQFAVSLQIRHSGTDYTSGTLPTGPAVGIAADGGAAEGTGEALSRLAEPAALQVCLTAVTVAHPGTVTLVEYARYEERPALIIVVQDGSVGGRTVVVGPDCGLPGSGVDEVYITPVR